MYYNNNREDKKDLNNLYNEEYNDNNDSEEDDSEEDSSQDMGEIPSKGNFIKGIAGKAGKTIKNVAKVIAMLPLPVKIALGVAIGGIITYLIMKVNTESATAGVTSSTNNTVSSMETQVSDLQQKKEDGTITAEEEEKLEKLEKAIEQFNGKNSYLYFTISNINEAYDNFVSEYKGSTNDVQSRNYNSLSTEFGDNELTEENEISRIVNPNQKLPLYIHLLMTEKYNFNAVKWKWYGHGRDGIDMADSNMVSDMELGLKYPNDGTTKLETFVDLLSPYMLTWHIPLGFHSGFLTKSGSDKQASNFTYSIVKNAYSDIIAHRYDIQKHILNTKFDTYYEYTYKSQFKSNIKVTYEYHAQTKGKNEYRVDNSARNLATTIESFDITTGNSISKNQKVAIGEINFSSECMNLRNNGYEIKSNLEETIQDIYNIYKKNTGKSNLILSRNGGINESYYSELTGNNNKLEVMEFRTLRVQNDKYEAIRAYIYEINVDVITSQEYVTDSNGNKLYDMYIKYEYEEPEVIDPELVSKSDLINSRINESTGEEDPMREAYLDGSTTTTNKYYISKAKTFDVIIANEFNYIKYNEDDVAKRINPKSESQYSLEHYLVEEKIENKLDNEKIKSTYLNETLANIESNSNITCTSNKISESKYYNDIKNVAPDTKVEGPKGLISIDFPTNAHATSSDNILSDTQIYQNTYRNENEYVVKEGNPSEGNGTHYIKRIWEDTLTQNKSETNTLTENDLIDFNAKYNANFNGTALSEEKNKYEKLVDDSEDSYSQYKALAATKMLTTIDFVNSNSNIYNDYLLNNTPQSKIMGYNREYIKFALDEVKRLFKQTEDKNGTIPYVYGISLGFTNILAEKKSTKLNSSSGLFCWPTDNEYISSIQGYSTVYGEPHGGIDIWAAYNDYDINHDWNNPSVPVYAAAAGEVIIANDAGASNGNLVSESVNGGCGNYIVIKHDNGYITVYMHLSTGTFSVSVGDKVQKGQQIALIGSSGNSSCMHLHFNIYNNSDGDNSYTTNDRLDPLEFYKIEVNEEMNPEGIEYVEVINNESLRSKIDKFNMFKYVGSIGSGEVISEPLPELTDSEKDELVSELNGIYIYNTVSSNRPSDIQNLWVLQYYSDNPTELLARAMYAEMVVRDSTNEAGVYAIAAQMKATLNHIGGADNVYSNFTNTGYLAYSTFVSSNFTTNDLPQFYRQMAAAILEDTLPNPPGFNGDEEYWIGSSDYVRPDGTSNHWAYNDNCIQTCGFSPNGLSFHVFLAGRQGATGLLQKSNVRCDNGNRFKMNESMRIADNIYVNEAAGGSTDLNYDEIMEVINKY